MPKLTEQEFKATFAEQRIRVGLGAEPPFDFWGYFEGIDPADFGGYDFSAGDVTYAYDMGGTPYQHVLVECETPNVFLALVLNLAEQSVTGHHLLDLNQRSGLA